MATTRTSDRFVVLKAFIGGILLSTPFAIWSSLHQEVQSTPVATPPIVVAPPVCTPAPTPPPPPARPPASITPTHPNATIIEARWGTHWYPVEMQGTACGSWLRVHWTGYGEEWDSVVHPSDLRASGQPTPEPIVSHLPAPQGSHPRVAVEARMGSTWRNAQIVGRECGGMVRVHYTEYDQNYDEVVPADRIRRRQ